MLNIDKLTTLILLILKIPLKESSTRAWSEFARAARHACSILATKKVHQAIT